MSRNEPPSFVLRLRRFTTWNLGQQVALAALSLVATPLLYHRLGDTAYGVLAIVNLLAAQLAILEFGFGHATIRWVAQCRARGDDAGLAQVVGTSLWVFVATSAVGGTALLVAAEPLVERFFNVPLEVRPTAVAAVRLGSLFFVTTVLGNLASGVWQGLQRFGTLNLLSGVASALQILGSLALVMTGSGVVAVVVWSTVLGLITLLAHVHWLSRALPVLRGVLRLHRPTLRAMARFGFLLMIAGALTQLFQSGGPIALGHFVAVGALPFFTVPLGLWQRLNRLAYGLAGALFPLVSELESHRDQQTLEKVFVSGTRVLLLAGVASMAPAVLLASPFLSVWMGADFAAHAGPTLEILFVAFVFGLALVPSIEIARGTGRPELLVGCTAVQATVILVGVAVLAPIWGATGAGVAFLAAQAAGFTFLVAKVGGRALLQVFRPATLLVVAGGCGATAALLALTTSPWLRSGAAVVLGVGLSVASLLGASSAEERGALRRLVGRP